MHMRRVLLILPFVVPFVFHALYQPINAAWTVKRFGCGCPPVTANPDDWFFNANYFNLILWCGVAAACGISWWFLLRPEFTDRKSARYVVAQSIGLGVLLCICANRLAGEIWL